MLFGLLTIIIVFTVIQLYSFNKLVNEEFGGVESYLKNIQKHQNSESLKKFKKNLFYQGILILIICVFGIFLDKL